jgi:hypothetical protein
MYNYENRYTAYKACDLFRVHVVTKNNPAGHVLWDITIEEAYNQTRDINAQLIFYPCLSIKSLSNGLKCLDLNTQSYGFTLATAESVIELGKIKRKIERWSVADIIKWSENGRH